ncbi:hypothetical protein CCH79_00020759, partial [Gambusia affinis]
IHFKQRTEQQFVFSPAETFVSGSDQHLTRTCRRSLTEPLSSWTERLALDAADSTADIRPETHLTVVPEPDVLLPHRDASRCSPVTQSFLLPGGAEGSVRNRSRKSLVLLLRMSADVWDLVEDRLDLDWNHQNRPRDPDHQNSFSICNRFLDFSENCSRPPEPGTRTLSADQDGGSPASAGHRDTEILTRFWCCGVCRAVLEQRDRLYEKMSHYLQLKNAIQSLEEAGPQRLKADVDLGCSFFVQARAPALVLVPVLTGSSPFLRDNPSRILVLVGFGFYVEMSHQEALRFIDKKTNQLTIFTEQLTKDTAKIKANIRMVLEGLRELQGLEELPDICRKSAAAAQL